MSHPTFPHGALQILHHPTPATPAVAATSPGPTRLLQLQPTVNHEKEEVSAAEGFKPATQLRWSLHAAGDIMGVRDLTPQTPLRSGAVRLDLAGTAYGSMELEMDHWITVPLSLLGFCHDDDMGMTGPAIVPLHPEAIRQQRRAGYLHHRPYPYLGTCDMAPRQALLGEDVDYVEMLSSRHKIQG
ncbi:uncharacterized protein EHS24_003570 [Apiotrichum porosum]|uniref:Uncharacterized protein n=1 Tax=Apiotrichum porosum TaxID=105984 RepID=A0A427XEB7_9TREE|nr:uncharacterized protein EHS24_003570 [Apiotrichum porosum]RSH77261.1 hypothetical protein EHS24_003570 [Apiotrichum porosum]